MHPATKIIFRLRTDTGRLDEYVEEVAAPGHKKRQESSVVVKVLLEAAKRQLAGMDQDDVDVTNAQQIVGWLLQHSSARSVHQRLDQVTRFLRLVEGRDIYVTLLSSTQRELMPLDTTPAGLASYFAALRSLFKRVRTDKQKSVPVSLYYRLADQQTQRRVIVSADIDLLIDTIAEIASDTAEPAKSSDAVRFLIALILICLLTGLRYTEARWLTLGDIWVTDYLTVLVVGKMGKYRTVEVAPDEMVFPPWILDFLRALWRERWDRAGGDFHAPFFSMELFESKGSVRGAVADPVYQRVRRHLLRANGEGLHSLRRYLANRLRAQEKSLLDVINILGQATSTTAPAHYLQIYPLLQREQLEQWADTADDLQAPPDLSLKEIATSLGMSRDGVYKMARRLADDGKFSLLGRASRLSLHEANLLLRERLRRA